jgi:signal transduction histidine kinase
VSLPAHPPKPAADARLLRLVRSLGFRIAALHAVLLIASGAALGAFFWWNTAGYLNRQVDQSLRNDVALMTARFAEGGIDAVIRTIAQRLAEDSDEEEVFLLIGPDGRSLAGNLESWPADMSADVQWIEAPIRHDGITSTGRLYAMDLVGGYRLIVGRDVANRVRLRELVGDAVLYGSALAVLLAGLGGVLVQRVLQRRIDQVAVTAVAIGHGDLSCRVPLTGADDEFDELARIFNGMLDRIGGLMDGVRQVSNAIAHDLRTPIARTRARLEEALHDAQGEAELRAAMERGIAELDGIIAVFQAILRIAEIEAGARRSAFAPFDLSQLLADAAELYEAVAEEKGVWLDAAPTAGLVMVGDRDLVLQAVANLLDNAIKFTPPGGRVQLAASRRGEVVEIVVADTGPGIPETERPRVTERFYRAEASRGTPGSGLGLTLVEAVAHLHTGTLDFGGDPEGGPGLRAVLRLASGEVPRHGRGAEAQRRRTAGVAPEAWQARMPAGATAGGQTSG